MVEPEIGVQFVVRPTLGGFVWPCKVQPVWSEGQVRSRELPMSTALRLVGFVAVDATTRKVPFTVNWEVSQASPTSGVDGTMDAKDPVYEEEIKMVKLSPAASVPLRLDTFNVPP